MGRAFASSGNDELRATTLPNVPSSIGGTMTCWWKPTFNSGDGQEHMLGGYWVNDGTVHGCFFQRYSDSKFYIGWYGTGDTRIVFSDPTTGGRWYHMCYTWTSTTGEVFIDGVSKGTSGSPSFTTPTMQTMGQYEPTVGIHLNLYGSLAHWARWQRKLTNQEIIMLAAGMDPRKIGPGICEYKPLYGIGTAAEIDLVTPGATIGVQSGTTMADYPTLLFGDEFIWDHGVAGSSVLNTTISMLLSGVSESVVASVTAPAVVAQALFLISQGLVAKVGPAPNDQNFSWRTY